MAVADSPKPITVHSKSCYLSHSSLYSLDQLVSTGQLREVKKMKVNNLKSWCEKSNGQNLLHIAATSNQVDVIRYLAGEAKVDINGQDSEGNTPLHLAVTSGHAEATNALLQCGANNAICNKDLELPIYLAIKLCSENVRVFSQFVRHPSVNMHMRGAHKHTCLHVIAKCNAFEALKLLYTDSICEDTSTISAERDKNGLTAFHLAAQFGSYDVLELVLSKCGSNTKELLNNLSSESRSPLHYAVECRHLECVAILLKYGGDPTLTRGAHSYPPPLHVACWHGNVEAVKLMVDVCGRSILQSLDGRGMTVLHYTPSVHGREMISYLVESGAPINDVDMEGSSPLAVAIKLGNLVAISELLRLKADPLTTDNKGNNLLHIAVSGKRINVLKLLVNYPSAVTLASKANNDSNYPIHLAIKLDVPEMVSSLLRLTSEMLQDGEGSNYLHLAALLSDETILTNLLSVPEAVDIINAPNHKGYTPLHYAAMGSNPTAVRKLSEHGAVLHRSNTGLTPFLCACSKGNLEAAKFLCNIDTYQRNWVNHDGCTALHAAAEGGNKQLVTFCLDEGIAITLNNDQLSFLDEILDMDNKELAKAVISHKRWAECIDVYCPSKPHPILRILDQMPDIYGIMLDKCFSKSSLPPTDHNYWEEFNFKCLDLKPEPFDSARREGKDEDSYQDVHEMAEIETDNQQWKHARGDISIDTMTHSDNLLRGCVKDKDSLAVVRKLTSNSHKSYLLHPVVASYTKMKWEGLGMYSYILIMLCHFLFALFFSIFLVAIPQPLQNANTAMDSNISENASNSSAEVDSASLSSGATTLLYICLLLGMLHVLFCLVEVVSQRTDLIVNFDDELQTWSNFLSTVNILVFLTSVLVGGLDSALWNAAALGVFFAWTTFNLSLQLISILNLGVYVIMITRTTMVVFKVAIIFLLLLFSFTFSFYILVGTVEGLHYDTIGLSLYSNFHTIIATTDYLGFADLEQAGLLRFSTLVFILLVALIILLPIVFINILIGLAVGDIAEIQKEAVLTQQAVEVRALSTMDKWFVPKVFKAYTSKRSLRIYPNRYHCGSHFTKLFHTTHSTSKSSESDQLKELRQELSDQREFFQRRLDQLHTSVKLLASDYVLQLEGLARLQDMVVKPTTAAAEQSQDCL